LVGSDYAGADAEVAVTVSSVKTKELPELDDDFAQTASEFDSLEELRSDLRDRLQRVKRLEQGMQARDKVLEELLARTDVPLPDSAVEREVSFRVQAMEQQLEAASLTREVYLEQEGSTAEQLDSEIDEQAREAVKAQLVLDALAQQEQIGVTEGEMSQHIVTSAARLGISPDVFVQRVSEGGQVPALVSEVVRGKALALVLGTAKITDASGRSVDLAALREDDTADAVDPPLSESPAEPAPEPAGVEVPADDTADADADADSGVGETSTERPAADASR
jgi:trigger factor